MNFPPLLTVAFAVSLLFISTSTNATSPLPMMRGDSKATSQGWVVTPLFTVGQTVGGYSPPGVLDGLGAFAVGDDVRVLVSHEFRAKQGTLYSLDSKVRLSGARISYLDINPQTLAVTKAGIAYDNIFDRKGKLVIHTSQINGKSPGLSRLCSARSVMKGEYQFSDNLFFAGEETDNGSEWVLDVDMRELWAFPAMGRGAWENVTPIETGHKDTIALLAGDDRTGAPLYLYTGEKNGIGDNSFLDRNGLKQGVLSCWKSDNEDSSPADFHGTGELRQGKFISLIVRNTQFSGHEGYDESGYLDAKTLRKQAIDKGCFSFSRPEDLHENPANPTQAVFASTGRWTLFPKDNWGTLYVIDLDFTDKLRPKGVISILHDADGLANPDDGIRNPDNLTWGYDGYIYVQEDRSVFPKSFFGKTNGIEASIWQIDPISKVYKRIGEIDRHSVYPSDATDPKTADIGNWESSGILDVSPLFSRVKGETVLMGTVQAHSVKNGSIKSRGLVQSSQLFLMRK